MLMKQKGLTKVNGYLLLLKAGSAFRSGGWPPLSLNQRNDGRKVDNAKKGTEAGAVRLERLRGRC